jgi:hypothetical protein
MIGKCWTTQASAPTGWSFAIIFGLISIGCGNGDGGLGPPDREQRQLRGVVQSSFSGKPVEGATVEQSELVPIISPPGTAEPPTEVISSGVTNPAGEFDMLYWVDQLSNCGVGWLAAKHDTYVPSGDDIDLVQRPLPNF